MVADVKAGVGEKEGSGAGEGHEEETEGKTEMGLLIPIRFLMRILPGDFFSLAPFFCCEIELKDVKRS